MSEKIIFDQYGYIIVVSQNEVISDSPSLKLPLNPDYIFNVLCKQKENLLGYGNELEGTNNTIWSGTWEAGQPL